MKKVFPVDDIIDRFKDVCNTEDDQDVAQLLGMSPQNLSNKKKAGTIVWDIIGDAVHRNVNLHWLLTGAGSMYSAGDAPDDEIECLRREVRKLEALVYDLKDRMDTLDKGKTEGAGHFEVSGKSTAM